MASQVMDERRMSPSSYYPEEISYPTERQVGFWEHETMLNHQGLGMDELLRTSGNKAIPSSQLEYMEIPQPYQKAMPNHVVGAERATNLSASWRSMDNDLVTKSKQFGQPTSYFAESNKVDMGSQYENGLLSSSISEMFGKTLKLSSNGVLFSQSVGAMASHHDDDEPFQSLEEIEAQTIGNLLPDDDDLLSGVNGDVDYILRPNSGDDVEDLDIFSSGGGMELEGDGGFNMSWIQRNLEFSGGISSGQQGGLKSSFVGEHPCGENPSRTLFVRNINSNVEDSELRALFEQYGDIRTLYTACKHRGFVMISYYDIRAASKAIGALQNKPLRRRKLDIHFSIPKDVPSEKDINQGTLVVSNLDFSVSNHDLHRIFGVFGEIKEICEAGHISDHKFIEFYDIRAAEAALRALNKMDIAGKCIKLELSHAWSAKKCSMEQSLLELKHEESIPCLQPGSSPSNSLSGGFGPVSHGAITSSCADAQGLNPVIGVPISRLMENGFQHGFSPSIPQNLASSAGGAPCGNQARLGMPNPSMGQMEFGFRQMPTFHPNSLPEYRDGLANGVPYNSPGTTIANTNPRPTEGFDNRHISGFGLNRNSIEPIEHSVFGSGNGSFPYHGPHHMWNPSNNSHRPHPPNHMMWLNSQSHVNGVHGHPSPQMHRLPRAPSHMLNAVPLHHHHVGSAPVVNPSLWDRRVAYSGESHDVGFHPGSLGSTGFSGSPTMHPLDLASHNIFPSAGGNCVDPLIASCKNVGLHSPQCHMFPRGNSMGNLTNSFDTPNERVRNRKIEINSYQVENKKQFELDIERILRKEDTRTTLMIKNIPNKYTSKMLLSAIDESNRGTYDFFYLPIDFKNKCNVGYAFINMVDPLQIVPFYQAFNGKKWEKFNSEKVVLLAYARIQGKAALVSHFQNSSLMTEDKRCRPILFHTDGPNAGDQEPFPVGTNIRSRPSRTRTHSSDGNRHGSPSTSANGEQNATDSSSGSE